MKHISSIAIKEFKEIWRNRLFLVLAFFVPFVMFVVFGYGITLDIENMPFGYIDYDKTPLSRDLIDRFTGRYFHLEHVLEDTREAEELMKRGRLRAVLVIPPDFTEKVKSSVSVSVQLLIDGGFPYTALTVKGYGDAIVASFREELLYREGIRRGVSLRSSPVSLDVRYLFNESLKSSYALVPGLLVIVLLVNPAVLTAIAIAREKEFGTIYNIYSTPVRKTEFILGKIIPYMTISTINFFILIGTIKILFHIPMKGSVADLVFPAILYVVINVSIGLLISSITKTVVSAQIITLIVTVIPAFLYSGLLIPVSNLGTEGQVMSRLYPSRYFMEIVHGVYLKRLGVADMLAQIMMLIFYMVMIFTLAVAVFKKREG